MRSRSLIPVVLFLLFAVSYGNAAFDPQSHSERPEKAQSIQANFLAFQAFWIDRTTILIPRAHLQPNGTYKLFSDPNARLEITANELTGRSSMKLICCGKLTADELARFPQLATGYAVLKLPAEMTLDKDRAFLKGQLAISIQREDGSLSYATGVQDAGVLDDLYAYAGELGVVIHHSGYQQDIDTGSNLAVKVWAPTAQAMSLRLFRNSDQTMPSKTIPMREHNGVWIAVFDQSWIGHYYLLDETVYAPTKRAIVQNIVTDPYSIDLALNGAKSRITDMDAIANKPIGWDEDRAPALANINDLSIYELHVRDFSVADETVPTDHRGTYLAFTDETSNGMKHLRSLANAGMKAVHLLPTFHFNGVNEDKSTWKTTGDLTQYAPDGRQQQAAVATIKNSDGYNWGYDPIHYLAPQGSYAVNPDDRVREYRSMVMALHSSGLRVIQDVVFNHTSGFGQSQNSVLDKIVPNYYNRLDLNGNLLTSSCCANTASEHFMMGRLQEDAVVWNAKNYKIDGFRFDLMGFTFRTNMERIRQALDKLTLSKDGVDGSKIYIYGEGWEFGETAHDALGVSATQLNLYGTGIGTFNDRLRDGVRGGKVLGDSPSQGFATGLFTQPSDYSTRTSTLSDQRNTLLHLEDWIRVGLAGNLRDFRFTDASGTTVTSAQVDYDGKPTGYAATPTEVVNYVSAHDNHTLFDAIQIKSAANDSAAMRARRQVLAMSVVALGQGIPFFMAGDDLLRSKDMDSDSYDSGDWFNKIDWSGNTNNWGIGLPLANHASGRYSYELPLLSTPALKPSPAEIKSTATLFKEYLQVRYSSGLFRMATLKEIQEHLRFLNTGTTQEPGIIAMTLDSDDPSYGPYRHILVVFNATISEQTVTSDGLKSLPLQLHPAQVKSVDNNVRSAKFVADSGTATVPALTTAVFVSAQ